MNSIDPEITNKQPLAPSLIKHLRHELRTPINAIIGYSEMLLEDLIDTELDQIVNKVREIHTEGIEILSIINNIVSPGNLHIQERNIDFSDLKKALELQLAPSLIKIIHNCKFLKQKEQINEFFSDIERISTASISLQDFITNIVGLKNNFNIAVTINNSSIIPNKTALEIHKVKEGHILVVDDNKNNRDLLKSKLSKEGYSISTANNGNEALEMVKKEKYDLILLDLLMPELNGYEVLTILKSSEAWLHIPVIMISALDEIDNVARCIKIGAEDYLPKPFNSILLKARISACLEKKQLRDRERESLKKIQIYSEKLNQELEKGREMQLNFLPSELPQLDGWEMAAFFQPARQVAGDFYDTFSLPNNNVALVIADVCDKGVGAALFMALFRSLIRIFSCQNILKGDISKILLENEPPESGWLTDDNITNLAHLNALQAISLNNDYVANYHGDLGMFATIFMGILNPDTGLLTYINGGHESLFILNTKGEIKNELSSTGPAVGMISNMTFQINQVFLEKGDILFGYTDGVTDARAMNKDFFTHKRLVNILKQPISSAQSLIEKIKDSVLTHIGNAEQFDDITMLAVQRYQ